MYQTRASGAAADFFFSLTQPNERTFQPNERTKRYVKYVGLEALVIAGDPTRRAIGQAR